MGHLKSRHFFLQEFRFIWLKISVCGCCFLQASVIYSNRVLSHIFRMNLAFDVYVCVFVYNYSRFMIKLKRSQQLIRLHFSTQTLECCMQMKPTLGNCCLSLDCIYATGRRDCGRKYAQHESKLSRQVGISIIIIAGIIDMNVIYSLSHHTVVVQFSTQYSISSASNSMLFNTLTTLWLKHTHTL